MSASADHRTGRPTMRAIAERAGVSRATVSIILSNPQAAARRFKPETIQKVHLIAERLGYQVNLMAVSLRNPHPSFFALVLRGTGDVDAISWHHQAFEGRFQAGVIDEARKLGLYPVLATQDSPDASDTVDRVRGVLDGGVFGAILRTPLPLLDDAIRRRIERGFPAVVVFPDEASIHPCNVIDMDNRAAGRMAGELLANAGRRHWAIVRDAMPRDALRLRQQGAAEIAREVGARIDVVEMPRDAGDYGTIDWLAPRLNDLRPDGVYAASSVAGVGTLMACHAAGLRVPEDTCLVGCDASLWRAPGCPPIGSVDVSWHTVGELAVRQLVSLRDEAVPRFENMAVPPQIRRGGTCPGSGQEPSEVVGI